MMTIKKLAVSCAFFLSVWSVGASFPVYASPVQFGADYYDFVSANNISWLDAENAAASSTFMGVNGYLATITSAAENSFLTGQFANFSSFTGAWLGGEVNASGTGTWMTGPESGQIFSQGGVAVPGAYANWGGVEPNNAPSAVYMNVGTPYSSINTGQWADAANGVASTGDPIGGYFVEYSVTTVPEPPTIWLWLVGIGLLNLYWHGKKQAA